MRAVCHTCMHQCSLEEGQRGICGARINKNGTVLCANYGRVTSLALDPIEKKPLKMFYPGSLVLSAGSFGCNLKCPFCQNHGISMESEDPPGTICLSPDELAEKALQYKNAGNIGVAFTYNEPLVGWEYVHDTARLIKKHGMKNILVTNGSFSLEVLERVIPFLDAMNIDLKGFRDNFYKKLGGDLETVKSFIVRASASCHVELTTLIIPGENDSILEMEEEAKWIASAVGKNTPLHVTRFFPRYQMLDKNPTDVRTVFRLADTARRRLGFVWTGNC